MREVDVAAIRRWRMNCKDKKWIKERPHTKKPITLPTPNIRAAQALTEACSDEGIVSTRRARSTAITTNVRENVGILNLDRLCSPTLIEKSIKYMAKIASHIVTTSF
jgi:hypothetical protein